MSTISTLLFVIFFCNIGFGSIFINGPTEIIFQWIRDCPEYINKDLPLKMIFRVHKVNRTIQVIDVNASLPFACDNSVSVLVTSERWGAGGWMKNAFSLKERNVCLALNAVVGNLWFEIEEKIGMVPKKCPIPPGNYYSKDTVIDLQKMAVQTFMAGQFKTRIKLFKSRKLVFCKDYQLELKEKPPYT